eukprot:TRINITY_DN14134_c0_g1_i1.p1 TRINITY_DN14134_c0_g1~~TRINITY_DN14134_c0_g1_i1.p1  ORF type:complete len:542 (+),score=105.39 TRINITY_DN14134_c0_g1_i1:583-2208(+)
MGQDESTLQVQLGPGLLTEQSVLDQISAKTVPIRKLLLAVPDPTALEEDIVQSLRAAVSAFRSSNIQTCEELALKGLALTNSLGQELIPLFAATDSIIRQTVKFELVTFRGYDFFNTIQRCSSARRILLKGVLVDENLANALSSMLTKSRFEYLSLEEVQIAEDSHLVLSGSPLLSMIISNCHSDLPWNIFVKGCKTLMDFSFSGKNSGNFKDCGFESLNFLHVCASTLCNEEMVTLGDIFVNNRSLRHLSLYTDRDLEIFNIPIQRLCTNESLRRVELQYFRGPMASYGSPCNDLGDILLLCKRLEDFRVSGWCFNESTWRTFCGSVGSHTHLEILSLEYCRPEKRFLSASVLELLFENLCSNHVLKILTLMAFNTSGMLNNLLPKLFLQNNSLISLGIQSCEPKLGRDIFDELTQSLSSNHSLRELCFQGTYTGVSHNDLSALENILAENKTLCNLSLGYSWSGEPFSEKIGSLLSGNTERFIKEVRFSFLSILKSKMLLLDVSLIHQIFDHLDYLLRIPLQEFHYHQVIPGLTNQCMF